MGRRYYRRTRTIVRAPRKKWATNIKTINYSIEVGSDHASPYTVLVTNSVQSSAPTPVILKSGNFKVNADVNFITANGFQTTNHVHLVAFIVFLPEGVAPSNNQQFGNLITAHPEYIMAWRQLDTELIPGATPNAVTKNLDRVTFSSRLKRNLNSGDSIVFGILDQSTSAVQAINVQLTCQFWTCSN